MTRLHNIIIPLFLAGCQVVPEGGETVDHPVSPNPLVERMMMKVQHGPAPQVKPMTAPAQVNRLLYYGGRILAKPEVVQVLWGSNVRSDEATGLADWYRNIVQSAYFDWLGEYDTLSVARPLRLGMGVSQDSEQKIGRGSFKGTVQITPALGGTTLADPDIFIELTHQIDAGVLPPPQEDGKGGYRTIYMIDFPAGLTITAPMGQGTSCVEFCAYHGAGVYKGKNLAYGIHPDLTQAGCAGGCGTAATALGNDESVHSHELVEATTDPDIGILINNGGTTIDYPVAWFADGNGSEIGDICNGQQAQFNGVTVQTQWSNTQGSCITHVNGLPGCVDGVGGGCSPCTSGAMCSGATAQCATDPADVKTGECVACLDSTTCAGATPVCDKSGTDLDDTCRACAANTECAAPTPVCAVAAQGAIAAGSCVACLASTDCTNDAPVCDTNAGSCGGCKHDNECLDPKFPSCDGDTGKCGEGGCSAGRGNGSLAFGVLLAFGLVMRRRRR